MELNLKTISEKVLFNFSINNSMDLIEYPQSTAAAFRMIFSNSEVEKEKNDPQKTKVLKWANFWLKGWNEQAWDGEEGNRNGLWCTAGQNSHYCD